MAAVLDCRKVTDNAERLACYDRSVAAFDEAETAREVVVVERAQIQETKKRLFGLALPKLPLFDREKPADEVVEVDGEIRSARRGASGQWIMTLAGGATWEQLDSARLARWPEAGVKVSIKRGALGSFKMNVGGQSAIKVRRVG